MRFHTRKLKHIGIVAGSPEGAALCYRTICLEGAQLLGEHDHPEVTMHTHIPSDYIQPILEGRWDEVGHLLLSSASKLASAGADFVVCPDNTLHQGLDLVIQDSPVPWLHIAEEIAAVADERGFKRVGILGTRWLMESPVYPAKLSQRGIAYEFPEPHHHAHINDVIMGELVFGHFESTARQYFQDVICALEQRGCDAVVLGCTEIPLLIGESDSSLPTLDSTRILARAALREATQSLRAG